METCDNKIWVRKTYGHEKTAGGLFITENEQYGGIREGYVVHVGPGRLNPYNGTRVPCCCKEGDHIIFNSSTGSACVIVMVNKETNQQESYFVMPDNEVIGIIDDAKESLMYEGDGSEPEPKPKTATEIIMQQTALQSLAESDATAPASSIITKGFGL